MHITGATRLVGSVFSVLSVWPTSGGPWFLHSSRLSSSQHSQLVQRACSEPRGREPLVGAGCLNADTAASQPPCVPGLAHHMCGFRMFRPQASNNPLFLFLALYVCLGSFVYFLKIFPFGLCFLACPIYGFSKCHPHWTPVPFITPHPENEGKLFRWIPLPKAWEGAQDHGATSPSPGGWRHLENPQMLCEIWVSFTYGSSDLPKTKKSHILIFPLSFFTIDTSSTDFLKL